MERVAVGFAGRPFPPHDTRQPSERRWPAVTSPSLLADLYDPDLMLPDLRKAHQTRDRAVDKLYRRSGFASERERVEHLFMLYEKMSTPLKAAMQAKPKRRRGRRKEIDSVQ